MSLKLSLLNLSLLLFLPLSFAMCTTSPTPFSALQSVANDRLASLSDEEKTARHQIFVLMQKVGQLSTSFLANAPLDKPSSTDLKSSDPDWKAPEETCEIMGSVLLNLAICASCSGLDLRTCILKKMALNAKKYPAELCKGKAGKYTSYSNATGITKTTGQSTVAMDIDDDSLQTVEQVRNAIRAFATERVWARYHTPRNLVLALMGELGELAELFQWKGDASSEELSQDELDKIGQEIADVSIYLLRLSDVSRVDLAAYVSVE